MAYEITVTASGPIFDGRSSGARKRVVREILEEVGRAGQRMVLVNLDTSIRHQTPYYTTRITHQRVSDTVEKVTDQTVIYGPWLEGTGSRNRTTRFKGYASFRRAAQQLDRASTAIADRVIERRLGEIG